MHRWNATQYYSTETVLLIFPFLQTNITVQMRPSGGWGGVKCEQCKHYVYSPYSQCLPKFRGGHSHVYDWFWKLSRHVPPLRHAAFLKHIRSTIHQYMCIITRARLAGWLSGRKSVSDRQTFTGLHRTCSWWETIYMGKPSAVGQPTRPTQPFILTGSINNK